MASPARAFDFAVAIECLFEIENAVVQIEQLVAQHERTLRKIDLRIAQSVQILDEPRLGID